MKQYIKNNVDTQLNNQCFGKFNMLDNVELEIKVLTNGDVGEAWEQPTFELIGVKMDKNEVRQTEGFEVLSLTEHTVKVALDEQFTTKDGVLDMQLVVKDNGRVSTCVFSFVVGKSLEGNIVESIRKIDTLDDLDVVVANLRDYEQQIDQIKTEVVATNEDIKIEEAKRKQDELVRVTKETARTNAEAIRQVNEEMRIALYETAAPSEEERQANEETRMVNETNRKIAEQTRISNENSRILAEQNRNETFETNEGVRNLQENKRVANENARINKFGEFEKNEIIRLASENNRLIQEIERVNNEENRINAEANRQAQENNREATYTRFNEKEKERQKAEDARQVAEQQRVNAELLRDQNYAKAETNRNKLYEDCEAQRNADFGEAETIRHETYTASEKERYTAYNQAELTRNQNEELRKNNESKRITNENTRIANEELRVQKEATRDAKVEEFLTRGEQAVIEIEQRTEEFLTRGEQVISDIEKRTDAALGILEGSAEEVADMRIDYMGNTHENMRQAANANVDYAVKTAIGEFNYLDYEGQHITANNSIEGHTKSAILKGMTETILDRFENGTYNAWSPTFIKGDNTKRIRTINQYSGVSGSITVSVNEKYEVNVVGHNTSTSTGIGGEWQTTLSIDVTNSIFAFVIRKKDGTDITKDEIHDVNLVTSFKQLTDMVSVRMPVLQTTGKNLCDNSKNFIGNINGITGVFDELKASILSMPIKVNHKNYVGSRVVSSNSSITFNQPTYRVYNSNMNYIGSSLSDLPETGGYVILRCIKSDGSLFLDNELSLIEFQLEENMRITQYEPYKSNILSTSEEVTLRGIGDVQDTLDLNTGEVVENLIEVSINSETEMIGYAQTIGSHSNTSRFMIRIKDTFGVDVENGYGLSDKIPYMQNDNDVFHFKIGDSKNGCFIHVPISELKSNDWNGFVEWAKNKNFKILLKSSEKCVKTVDLSDNIVYSYGGTTHYSCSSEEGSLVPTLSVKVPTDMQATIAQQRNTIQALESENAALKDGLIEANQYREDGDMDLLSNQWDIDFRLFEIEMALDVPMMATFKLKEADIMSRYLQAKTLILGGRYERSKMEYQLKRYLEAGQLTQEEYDELISLMDARELVE